MNVPAASIEPLENRVLRVHGTLLCLAGTGLAAAVTVGRLAGLGPFGLLEATPHLALGFFEAFSVAAVAGLFVRHGASLVETWRVSVIAAGLHVLLGVANVVHWDFFRHAGAQIPGAVATAAHLAVALLELAMARRNRARLAARRSDAT